MRTSTDARSDLRRIFDLDGRAALVTGGARGLGEAICEGLAAFGAQVSVVDVDGSAADALAQRITARGQSAISLQCDVTDEAQARGAVAQTVSQLGRVDVLVANAGIGDRNPAEEMTIEQWDRVMAVNLRGMWIFDQEVGRDMIRRGAGGSIVNMASIAGEVGVTTGNANYAASKGGVIALTRCLAAEWARHGIRVNAVAPTHFRTPLVAAAIEGDARVLDYFLGNIPLGRLGEPSDIVGAVVYLASSASSMVTGHVLDVDGGHTAV